MNKTMHILFLCQYFPPEMGAPSARTYEHTKRWVAHGNKVSVVTAVPNHPTGRLYPGYQNKFPYQIENKEGISIYRCWTYLAANAGKLRRILNYFFYMLGSVFVSLRVPSVHVVLATSPQLLCAIAGFVVAKVKRVPFVLEIRDLWPESILAVGAMKEGRVIRILHRLADYLYCHSDQIVVVTHSFKNILVARGIPKTKIHVIPNGVDLTVFSPEKVRQNKEKAGFQILYVGTLGMAHGLQLVLNAAEKFNTDIEFVLVGEGAEKKKLLQEKERRKIENVIFKDFVPREKVPELLSCADLCLVMLKKDKLFQTVIPSKMFEMMGMAKPVLLGVEGESLEILKTSEGGMGFKPGNLVDFVEKIKFLRENRLRLMEMGQKGRAFVEKNYNRDSLAKNYLTLLEHVTGFRKERQHLNQEAFS